MHKFSTVTDNALGFTFTRTTPDPDFKVTVFFDVKYLENVAR